MRLLQYALVIFAIGVPVIAFGDVASCMAVWAGQCKTDGEVEPGYIAGYNQAIAQAQGPNGNKAAIPQYQGMINVYVQMCRQAYQQCGGQ